MAWFGSKCGWTSIEHDIQNPTYHNSLSQSVFIFHIELCCNCTCNNWWPNVSTAGPLCPSAGRSIRGGGPVPLASCDSKILMGIYVPSSLAQLEAQLFRAANELGHRSRWIQDRTSLEILKGRVNMNTLDFVQRKVYSRHIAENFILAHYCVLGCDFRCMVTRLLVGMRALELLASQNK
eukprot:1887208-Amphidinium_carterae.2